MEKYQKHLIKSNNSSTPRRSMCPLFFDSLFKELSIKKTLYKNFNWQVSKMRILKLFLLLEMTSGVYFKYLPGTEKDTKVGIT